MKITEIDQFKMNHTYYYVNAKHQILEHQPDGVFVYACKYADWSKERTKKYGYNTGNADMLKPTKVLAFAGKMHNDDDLDTYMETSWCHHINFYTTLNEVIREAIIQVFIF